MIAVTDKCKTMHKGLWRALKITGGISGLLAVFVLYAVDKAHSVDAAFRAHNEGQVEAIKRIDESLSEIKAEQRRQRGMIEEIWQKGNGG